jgi:glycosyltransferase involved in cell wall biosynthesis
MTQLLADTRTFEATQRIERGRFSFDGVSVIVPCYNEQAGVAQTLRTLDRTMRTLRIPFELLVVDDGSTDGTRGQLENQRRRISFKTLRNEANAGYGYSLKRAIREARYEIIAITDADGTYPNRRIGELIEFVEDADMVVGARIGVDANVPLLRRPAKWALGKLAGYLTGVRIPDLNSGLRVMKRGLVLKFIRLLPDGFSFTTTITLALLTHGYRVRYLPISYSKRIGESSIRPIRDTMNFISLIVRTVMYFKPLKIFGPASLVLLMLALVVGLVTKFAFGRLADVSVLVIAMASLQVLGIGLLADLIDKRLPFEDPGAHVGPSAIKTYPREDT